MLLHDKDRYSEETVFIEIHTILRPDISLSIVFHTPDSSWFMCLHYRTYLRSYFEVKRHLLNRHVMILLLSSLNYWCNLKGYIICLVHSFIINNKENVILFVMMVFQYLITLWFYNNNKIDLFVTKIF